MLCRFFQLMISSAADSDGRLGPLTRRHILDCPNCRRFHRTCRTLGRNLRSEATVLSPASRRLTQEILSNVPPTNRRPSMKWAWPRLAAAACLTIAVLVTFSSRRVDSPPSPAPTPTYTIAAPRVELTRAWAQVVEAPLATEARNLSTNAESGLRFLVACLNVRPHQGTVEPSLGESAPPPIQ